MHVNNLLTVRCCCSDPRCQAVCSTSNDKAVTNLVKTLMGKERLDRIKIFAGDIVAKKKPHPDIYNLAKVEGYFPCPPFFFLLGYVESALKRPCVAESVVEAREATARDARKNNVAVLDVGG